MQLNAPASMDKSNGITADTTILASQTMAVQDLSCHPLHILQKAMLNKRFSIPTSIAEMNVFIGLLSVAGIFHENHKNPGNYGVSIKLQEEVHIWRFCLNMKPA
ncbi:Pentatricopeptide repeat-containing protein [Trichinella pseudospiralis]